MKKLVTIIGIVIIGILATSCDTIDGMKAKRSAKKFMKEKGLEVVSVKYNPVDVIYTYEDVVEAADEVIKLSNEIENKRREWCDALYYAAMVGRYPAKRHTTILIEALDILDKGSQALTKMNECGPNEHIKKTAEIVVKNGDATDTLKYTLTDDFHIEMYAGMVGVSRQDRDEKVAEAQLKFDRACETLKRMSENQ